MKVDTLILCLTLTHISSGQISFDLNNRNLAALAGGVGESQVKNCCLICQPPGLAHCCQAQVQVHVRGFVMSSQELVRVRNCQEWFQLKFKG